MNILPVSESVHAEVVDLEPKGKVQKKSGKRVGYNYIIIKSYKESQKNDVVKCLYIKSLTDFGFCVIKEGSYGDTKDKHGRDIIDRLKWQQQLHLHLQHQVRMPRLLGHFEERGNYYMVIGHVKGKALQKVMATHRKDLRAGLIQGNRKGLRFLDYLIQITHILEKLHTQGIVHRDATPNNYMITSHGKVALIDMEMCYSLPLQFPTPAFQLGTYGYMSPQQESTLVPTPAEDIFAFGAIILQMWSGVSPGKMTGEPLAALTQKIQFFIPDKQVADIVTQSLLPEDDKRPSAAQIREVLVRYHGDLTQKQRRNRYTPPPFSKTFIRQTLQEAIHTLTTPLLVEEDKGWFSDDMKEPTEAEKHKLRKQWYASFNRGVSGVVYMLAQAKQAGYQVEETKPYIQKALELIRTKYINRIDNASAGLHFGSDGIALTIAQAIRAQLIEPTDEHLEWIGLLLNKENSSLDVLHGVAGQGLANLACASFVSPQPLVEKLRRYASLLISKQHASGAWIHGYYRQKFTRLKKHKINKGFAEGMSGYICFLLEYGHQYKDTAAIDAATRGLQWLMKKAKHSKGFIYWRTYRDKELQYGWADGISGIALSFLKAYEHTNNPAYKKYATRALLGIPAEITDTNLSQRSGLSGLGETYLEAWRLLRGPVWQERAGHIAQVIMQLRKQHPKYGTYWLVEHERQPVANFMIGNAGVMNFLVKYCQET